jgi:phosphomannomutase/phosphoglucomutase
VDTDEEKKFEMVKRATDTLRAAGHDIIDVDGVRVTFPDGWGLIRASNTQPILVLRFEANSEARLKEIQALIEGTVAKVQKEVGG